MAYAFAIEPNLYIAFEHEAELLDKCKEWGLLSEKASKAKTFYYKGNGMNEACDIVGYVDRLTAVIQFGNGQKHCIHPSYLKEMQASNFGQRFAARAESESETEDAAGGTADMIDAAGDGAEAAAESESAGTQASALEPEGKAVPEPGSAVEEPEAATADEPSIAAETSAKAGKPSKAKSKKVELPEEKVRMTAIVKAFTTVPNHFSDNDDEVVIYEAVAIAEPALELGEAWSSHSATLKKLELAVGDAIAFEAKVIAKKLTKHPVPYKINNPSKIEKRDS